MKFLCSFKYELITSDKRRCALSRNVGCRRFVFNKALALQNERRKKGLALFRYKELCNELTQWKKKQATAFLKQAMSQPQTQAAEGKLQKLNG